MKIFLSAFLLFNSLWLGFFACALFHEHGGQWAAALVGAVCSGAIVGACGWGLSR